MHVAFGIAFTIFFIIGMCTYFMGCNIDYEDQCFAYNVVDGEAYGYKYTTSTCRECIYYNEKGKCVAYRYYDCYSAYVKFRHGSSDHSCDYKTCSKVRSMQAAELSVKSYPIGDTMTLLERKGASECLDLSTGMATWVAGVVFLSLAALVVILWFVFAVIEWINKVCEPRRTVVPVSSEKEMF